MTTNRIKWSPKVPLKIIKDFYENENSSLLDHKLIHDVALRIYLRCQSCILATEEKVNCPQCQTIFPVKNDLEICPSCHWQISRKDYKQSKRHRDLNIANALVYMQDFIRNYEQAKDDRVVVTAVDRVIHQFHWQLQHSDIPNRSVANNLIEGNHDVIVEFLLKLSSRSGLTNKDWKTLATQMMIKRKGQLSSSTHRCTSDKSTSS